MKFLLSKLNHLGDTLVMTPTIRFLREHYPEARIDVLVRSGCEVMLKNNPDIDNVIAVARPEKAKRSFLEGFSEFVNAFRKVAFQRYDYAFDLSDSDRGKFWICMSLAKVRVVNVAYSSNWKHRWLFNRRTRVEWASHHQVEKDFGVVADSLGVDAKAGVLVFEPDEMIGKLDVKLPFYGQLNQFAVIHMTSRWAYKEWLPERWAEVADWLQQVHGFKVVFSCGPSDREKAFVESVRDFAKGEHLSTEGNITLAELGALVGKCRIFLGVDTVVMHLAAAMQAPTVGLFGPSSEWSWHPWKTVHEVVLGKCKCKKPPRKFSCDMKKILPCIDSIKVTDVKRAVSSVLALSK